MERQLLFMGDSPNERLRKNDSMFSMEVVMYDVTTENRAGISAAHQSDTGRMYFAYDTPSDLEPLIQAGRILRDGGITKASHRAACYVLIGYPGDTMDAADARLRAAWSAGFVPYAMLYRDDSGATDAEWRRFQRAWLRPEIVLSQLKNVKEAA
jgi:hypothetical protein